VMAFCQAIGITVSDFAKCFEHPTQSRKAQR
jgi:hypothetical protein